MVVLPFIMCR